MINVLIGIAPHLSLPPFEYRPLMSRKAKMSTQPSTSQYLLLARGTHWDKGLSSEEIQKLMSRAHAWFDRLSQQGKAKGGQRLTNKSKIVSGKKGSSVTDGPIAESKEAIAGYLLLQVDHMDEAVEIAKEWPLLEIDGMSIEVRPVVSDMPARA